MILGYLNEAGILNKERFEIFMKDLALEEIKLHQSKEENNSQVKIIENTLSKLDLQIFEKKDFEVKEEFLKTDNGNKEDDLQCDQAIQKIEKASYYKSKLKFNENYK